MQHGTTAEAILVIINRMFFFTSPAHWFTLLCVHAFHMLFMHVSLDLI